MLTVEDRIDAALLTNKNIVKNDKNAKGFKILNRMNFFHYLFIFGVIFIAYILSFVVRIFI